MFRNTHTKKSGFTLVEIMIVVAIIALLAAIAVPSFLRARKRSQATSCLETCRVLDGAKEVFAIENNKSGTYTPTGTDLAPYIKKSGKLYNDLIAGTVFDNLGNSVTINNLDTPPKVDTNTKNTLSDALGGSAQVDTFFGQYK